MVGIDNESADDNLENDIIKRNEIQTGDGDLKMVHKYVNKNTNKTTAVLEVTQEAYKQIKKEKKIYVGWQRCLYHDDFNVNMCNKCCRFNHSQKKCKNKPVCWKCAYKHEGKDCTSEVKKCFNCTSANDKYAEHYRADHCAIDHHVCESYKLKLAKTIKNIDYPFG